MAVMIAVIEIGSSIYRVKREKKIHLNKPTFRQSLNYAILVRYTFVPPALIPAVPTPVP